MPSGYIQERFESVAGNETNSPTLSTKMMYPVVTEFTPDPGTDPMERDDELRGSEEALPVISEAFNPTWAIRARAYPDQFGWRLKHILGVPTTTAGDGVITDPDSNPIPVGAFRHQWKSDQAPWGSLSGSDRTHPMTAQMIAAYKDQSVFVKIKGAACDSLAIDNPESGGVQIAAGGPALFLDDQIADPVITPAFESLATSPFVRGGLSLPTWLASSGTKDDFDINIASPVERVRSLGVASKWADVMEKAEGILLVTGSVSLHQLTKADLTALRASSGFPIMARWVNDTVIASGYKHTLWIQSTNAQYISGGPASLANARRIGGSFDFRLSTTGSGAGITVTLVNATASYA